MAQICLTVHHFLENYLLLSLNCHIMYSLFRNLLHLCYFDPEKSLMLRGSDFCLDFAYISSSLCHTDLDLCF